MKVKYKITIITLAITFAFIFFSNIVFSNFFANYLESQEDAQIDSIRRSAESFISEKMTRYLGNVNDYSHWDDTYDFIKNKNNQKYIDGNFIEDTFSNLEVNFIIFIGEDNSVRYQQYYDIDNNRFTQFPLNFDDNLLKIIKLSESREDTSSIMKIGDQFYFVVTSVITDSNKVKKSNGRMVIGRLIDENMIKNLEEITNGSISFSTTNQVSDEKAQEGQDYLRKKTKETVQIGFVIPNTSSDVGSSSVMMTIVKKRDLFINGMNQIKSFMLTYTVIMILILFAVFYLLGRYLSRPIIKLVNDVKKLNLSENTIQKLEVHGQDEFAFLRNSVNAMLSTIEVEQYQVRENKENYLQP